MDEVIIEAADCPLCPLEEMDPEAAMAFVRKTRLRVRGQMLLAEQIIDTRPSNSEPRDTCLLDRKMLKAEGE
jgi:hypothetical protein